MTVFADVRGIAISFEDEGDLDLVIIKLQEMRDFKRRNNTPYPGVFTYTGNQTDPKIAKDLHDEVWWMGYSLRGRQPGPPKEA